MLWIWIASLFEFKLIFSRCILSSPINGAVCAFVINSGGSIVFFVCFDHCFRLSCKVNLLIVYIFVSGLEWLHWCKFAKQAFRNKCYWRSTIDNEVDWYVVD